MVPRNEPQATQPRRPWLLRQLSSSYPSLISPTSSAEGDDEHSIGDDDYFDTASITYETLRAMAVPAHDDEDSRPTSQKELAGWYCYGWASECFAICAMASFLPVTLEQLARDQGVLLSDKKTPCITKWPNMEHGANVFSKPKELPACIVKIGHFEVNTASFAMYTFSISVLIQSLLIVSMSGAADHGRFRKSFLLVFAFTGAVALMLFLAVTPQVYLLGALLAIVSNTCFGASFVLLNSFLPVLVRHHPTIQAHAFHDDEHAPLLHDAEHERREYNSTEDTDNAGSNLLPQDIPDHTIPLPPAPSLVSEELKLATKISSYGIGIGYIAGLLVQISAIFIVVATKQTTFSLRLVLFVVGVWWFVFTIPSALWLRPRPGPPLPASISGHSSWIAYILYAWQALFKTIRQARRLKDIVIFLAAWFLLSDGTATVSGTAILFAKTNLAMDTSHLALISVIGTVAGVVGAFYWSTFSRFLGLKASQTIMACVFLFELIPLYGLLGFIPAVKRLGFLGLQQPIEIYFLGALYGFVLGGLSSYCRAFFGELIPPGFEASFYALYAITDKGSSIFGPAIVGAITDRYGDIRPAFVFLSVLIFLPLPLLVLVDAERGKADAAAMALELSGKPAQGEHVSNYVAPVVSSGLEEDRQ